jgi:uncharacterized integral membrane protein (TIGR00698 family)
MFYGKKARMVEDHHPSYIADLYCETYEPSGAGYRQYLRGTVLVAAATMAAAYVSVTYTVPLTLIALLTGLSLSFLGADKELVPGLNLASGGLLRIGIVLIGARVTFGDVVQLGHQALLGIVVIASLTLSAGVLTARRLRLGAGFGVLAGGAVAICGVSAAIAIAGALGAQRVSQAQLSLVIVVVSVMSSFAMVVYPLAAHHFHLGDRSAGFIMGASIHDVAQALGAGYSYSQAAGDTAAIIKLGRVSLLVPLLALVSIAFPQSHGHRKAFPLPWFVCGFMVVVACNSAGLLPHAVVEAANKLATVLLACAVTASGIRSPLGAVAGSGLRVSVPVIVSSLAAFVLAASWTALFS